MLRTNRYQSHSPTPSTALKPTLKSLIFLYDGLQNLLWLLLRILKPLNAKLNTFMRSRATEEQILKDYPARLEGDELDWVFFCSSAGEYEQALPLLKSPDRPKPKALIIFFSPSGFDYALKRQEKTPFFLCPSDRYQFFSELFKRLKPKFCVVVRHEIWPGFSLAAAHYSKLILINATPHLKADRFFSRQFKTWIYPQFSRIFVSQYQDCRYLEALGLSTDKVKYLGDTKWDRVLERKSEPQSLLTIAQLKALILDPSKSAREIFVLGSAWMRDLECMLKARDLGAFVPRPHKSLILIAPHDLSQAQLSLFRARLSSLKGLSYTDLVKGAEISADIEYILIDSLGLLAELYALADLAFVGGALHYQVHNVLEPAVYGLAISFGPRYLSSPEAITLKTQGLAESITGPEALHQWWVSFDAAKRADRRAALDLYLKSHVGSARNIITELRDLKNDLKL